MRVGAAKAVAGRWVADEAALMPGFAGAFFHGGVTWVDDEAELAATSDVDLMIVLDGAIPDHKLGKIARGGVLLDVTYLGHDEVREAEAVLGRYHLAGSLASSSVVADPTGELTRLQAAVAAGFPRRRWVRARCDHVVDRIETAFPLRADDPLPDQVVAWLFPAGITTHLLLVAALRNPTVRRRYVDARGVLTEYGQLGLYPALLDLLGCGGMSRGRVEGHLEALAELFDVAVAAARTPFPFASDISGVARPIAIDGSRALIAGGDHREAVFWIVATACRCQSILAADAPGEVARFAPAFRALLADLGVASFNDISRRKAEVARLLPAVRSAAEAIIAVNPAIED